MNIIQDLYKTVLSRKENPEENSYTCYLFEEGLDKILKKCGEECAEMLIAAKNVQQGQASPADSHNEDLKNEISDLIFHVLVLCAECGLDWSQVEEVLTERRNKIGNKKAFRQTDKDT